MVILKLNADGTKTTTTVNMTEQEILAKYGPQPTTLQGKIEAIGDYPELNEIMAQLIDIPEEESEENGNEDTD